MQVWNTVLIAVIITVGLLEWLKARLRDAPKPLWWWLLPIICVTSAVIVVLLPTFVYVAFLVLAVAQLSYDNVVQLIKKFIAKKLEAE